jgi:hypothetical protein
MKHQNNHRSGRLWSLVMAFSVLYVLSGVMGNSMATYANSVEDLGGHIESETANFYQNASLPQGKSPSFNAGMTSNNFTLVGKNNSSEKKRHTIAEPIKIKVGVELDQISAVNQKDENFDVVANIRMQWTDPHLAFNPQDCDCSYKFYRSIDQFVQEYGSAFPEFTISNQQGNRWTQNEIVAVQPNGTATYFERFWVKLQAPDFNFRKYPLDSQDFYIHIDSLYPENFYAYELWPEKTSIGKQLGEEEWYITASDTNVSSIENQGSNSRYSFHFQAQRHLSYYVLRILLPIFVIVLISWITLFLKDYGKRADIAGGNLLLFIAFNFTIGSDLPKLGYLTFLDWIMFFTFILTALMFIYNISLKLLEIRDKKGLAERIDKMMVWLYPPLYFVAAYLIPVFLYRHF